MDQPHRKFSTDHLSQHITQNNGQLLIVTDASLNAQKFSAFSWIIATTTQELWKGDGTVPGTHRDAHSG